MPLSWNEIKSRAMAFSREWGDAADEASQAKPFWIAFFEIFGITDKRVATFELNVRKLGTAHGFVDLFWPGMLLVEHKSRGKIWTRVPAGAGLFPRPARARLAADHHRLRFRAFSRAPAGHRSPEKRSNSP
jgi:hypothetical protein